MPPKGADADIAAVNGDRLRLNDHVFHAPPWELREGSAYAVARIMEFLPPEGQPKAKYYTRARLAQYLRAAEPFSRQADSRLLIATMWTEIVPITSLRGKCYVSHRDKVANMAEWKKTDSCFYYHRFHDPFLKLDFEVILSEEINNIPPDVKKALTHRYEFVIVEKEVIPELTDDMRTCATCNEWCSFQESVRCDRCKEYFHMRCVNPPLATKPTKGWGWTCAPCAKRHEEEVDQHGVPLLKDRKSLKPGIKPKGKPDMKDAKGKADGKDAKDSAKPRGQPSRTVRYWKKWPFRYFGQHTIAEDTLDPDDFIYPIAVPRLGVKFQASIPQKGATLPQGDSDIVERGSFGTVQAMACLPAPYIETGILDAIMTEVLNKPLPVPPYSVSVLDEVLRTVTFESPERPLTFDHIYNQDTTMEYPWKNGEIPLYDSIWTPQELFAFEEGVNKFGADLWTVREEYVPTKTRAEVVKQYYLWKSAQLGSVIVAPHLSTKTFLGTPANVTATTAANLRTTAPTEAASEEDGSEAESPVRPVCAVCKTKTSPKWWKAPRMLSPPLMCDACSNSFRKYNDSRITRVVDEARSRVSSEKREGTPLAGPPPKKAKITAAPASKAPTPLPPPLRVHTPPVAVLPPPPKLKTKPLPPRFCVCCKTTGPGDTIARCQKCLLTVHPACGGFPKEEFHEPWTCDVCLNDQTLESNLTYSCLLCPKPDAARKKTLEKSLEPSYCRAMRPTEGRGWVHVMCAAFTPEVQFTDAERLRLAEGVSLVPQGRWKAQCAVCQVSHAGACIKCADCTNEFHLSCAWLAGCTFGFEIQPVKVSRREQHPVVTFKKETGAMSALVWCNAHDRSGRTIYSIGEVDPRTGLTALQTYCRTYKQVPVDHSYGLLRKAHRLDALMAARPPEAVAVPISPPTHKCRRCGMANSPFYWPDDIRMQPTEGEELLLCHACHHRKMHVLQRSALTGQAEDWEEVDSDYDEEEWY